MNYQRNKHASRTINDRPTATDQSQAAETDINVIIGRMLRTGTPVPGANGEPVYADWTQLPSDLRGMIELGRSLEMSRNKLPDQLKGIPIDQLINLTNDQILTILTPPETDKPKDEPK